MLKTLKRKKFKKEGLNFTVDAEWTFLSSKSL